MRVVEGFGAHGVGSRVGLFRLWQMDAYQVGRMSSNPAVKVAPSGRWTSRKRAALYLQR